ncbi:phosphodiesterase [Bradyrhizobium prioriisuperbiae]|uniref:phosphodiesterase n=1 Tax=Bradyrhizobium prioriisuperbiae TaxID=2854389 RepID=UPI0028EBCA9D|nr:phosphodiesterase [Bradyrhizobium prioritasuperba]
MLIAQISDLHICDDGALYKGVVSTNEMAMAAVRHVNSLFPQPDLVVLTGDVVEDGADTQYGVARRILAEVSAPLILIPGNHDDRDRLRAGFPQHRYMPQTGPVNYVYDALPVKVIAFDVTVPGAHHGHLEQNSLSWLDETLARDRHKPTVLLMHQPPFSCSVPYLDKYMCMEPERLASVIASYSNIERILCGHVHRGMQKLWCGTLVTTCPSTATQIALALREDAKPNSYLEPAACLLHHWTDGDGLVTHTSYIGAYPGPFPFA